MPPVRHCLQLWPGLSHFLPFFCPTLLLYPSDRSQPGLPHRKEEKGSHLFRRLLTYGPTPQGCREEGIMRNSCMQLTPGTDYRAADDRGRNTAKGNPQSLWGPGHCSPSVNLFDFPSWLHLLFPSSRYLTAAPSPWPDPDTPGQETRQESGVSGQVPTRLSGGSVASSTFSLQRTAMCTKKRKQC